MEMTQEWKQENRDFIRKKLIEYNLSKLPDEIKQLVNNIHFILRDESGKIVGGITGDMVWYRLHIDFLWVDESIRGKGYGKELLDSMENFARENHCKLIQLDTFSFQAPDFYQKHGYEVIGVIEEFPTKEHQQYFFIKRLD